MKARIFIVDDEKLIVRLYQDMLTLSGFEVAEVAYDGEEAIAKFRDFASKPDLVILDHRMPIKNGLETMADMLKIDPKSKILFISADATVKKAAMERGAVGFIEKPFELKDLVSHINSALETEVTAPTKHVPTPRKFDEETRVILKDAIKLGFEVAYRGHFESSDWVVSKRRELSIKAEERGVLKELARGYERGKALGKAKRRGRFESPRDKLKISESESAIEETPGGAALPDSGELIDTGVKDALKHFQASIDLGTLSSVISHLSEGSKENLKIGLQIVSAIVPMRVTTPSERGREILERGLQSLIRSGWIDHFSIGEYDETSGKISVSVDSIFAKSYGKSDVPICFFLEKMLSQLCSRALEKDVVMKERECVAMGAKYCIFSS